MSEQQQVDAEHKRAAVRPTAERLAKGDVIAAIEERGARAKPWQSIESVQDELLAGALISRRAWEAANEFQSAYYRANGSGMRAQGTGEPVSKSTGDMSNKQALAKLQITRWSHALAPVLFECLESVIGIGKSPSRWARDASHHPACGKLTLITALEQFALTLGGR